MNRYLIILLGMALICSSTFAAKILVIFPVPSKSHVGAYQPLMEELARRGHEMTVITPFPLKKPILNYNEIVYEDTFPPRDSAPMNLFEKNEGNTVSLMFMMYSMFSASCENLVKQPIIQNLIHNTDKEFDLIIYEPFLAECLYGFLHKYKVPSIQFFPNTIVTWVDDVQGNPSALSYVPDLLSQSENLDFSDKFFSLIRLIFSRGFRHLMILPTMDTLMRKYFPDPTIPSLVELEKNASLLFIHCHPILNFPRPLTPNTIDVTGMHIKTTPKLSEELKTYLDTAPYGVIYFSLGSNVRSADMPEDMRNAILKSFAKLKQRILWKWETDNLPGQPENVHLSKWFPQHDILAHPNVKLFITHGGLMSLEEATYFGVPMISIPVMGDQHFNAMHAENSGYAVVLDVQNITETSFDWALNEVLNEPRYRNRAQELARIFQDQPQTPLDRAVFWVEYIIRHKGAPHLRSAAMNLNFFQYYLLDVMAVIVLVTSVVLIVFLRITKIILKKLCGTTQRNSMSKTKKIN